MAPLSVFTAVSLLQHGPKMALYLYELLHDHKAGLSKEEQMAGSVFMTSLKLCGHRCLPLNTPPKPELVKALREVTSQGAGPGTERGWSQPITSHG